MKKIKLYRTLAIIIVIFNILNYFLMAASYTGFNVKESATLFDYTFINYTNIDGRWHIPGSASDNAFLPIIILLLVDLFLAYVLLFNTPKYGDYLNMPYKKIFAGCFVGMLLHVILLGFSVPSSSVDESYFTMIGRGMLLNTFWTIGYLVILFLFYRIKRKEITCNDIVKTKLNVYDVVILGILVELVLSYFYCTLVNRLIIKGVSRDGIKYTNYFGKLYLSEFMMLFKPKNYYNLSGKLENYLYMIIPLVILVVQILLTVFKVKYRTIIVGILSLISIITLTLGLCDMCDSIYPNYINITTRNFFKLVGIGYYYIIILNIALFSVYLLSVSYNESIIIGVNEIEKIVKNDTLKNFTKDEETIEEDTSNKETNELNEELSNQ